MKYNNLFDDVFKFKQQQNYLMNEFPFHRRTLSKNGKISDQVLMSSSLQSINSKYHHTSDDLIFCNLVMLELRQQGAFPTNACHSSSLGDKRAKEEGQIDSEWWQGGRGNHKPFSPHICFVKVSVSVSSKTLTLYTSITCWNKLDATFKCVFLEGKARSQRDMDVLCPHNLCVLSSCIR